MFNWGISLFEKEKCERERKREREREKGEGEEKVQRAGGRVSVER